MGRRVVDVPASLFADRPAVPSIAEQAQRCLQEREDARCRALELEREKPVKRREIPVPTVRVGPQALSGVEFLAMVTEFDYDLTAPEFCDYCLRRGTLSVAGLQGSPRWQLFVDHRIGFEEFLANPEFQFAAEHLGARHRYTAAEMTSNWSAVCLGRATLQDSWELFRASSQARR